MRTAFRILLCSVLLVLIAAPATALPGTRQLLVPPVDAPIGRPFDQPETAYSSGHRGVDYEVARGTPVRAAAAGRVSFAGQVAGSLAVTLDHPGGLQTTYSELSEIYISVGENVGQGRYIGAVGQAHPDDSGLHFGVKRDGEYVDPADYLGPIDTTGAIHLAPLTEAVAEDVPHELTLVGEGAGTAARSCRDPIEISSRPPRPTSNVAVAIAGIGSGSLPGTGAELFNAGIGPESLGYPERLVYRFSYAGVDGKRFHEPYGPQSTYGDLKTAAARLIDLLRRIHDRYPGRDVDLFGQSQGGIVARAALERMAGSFDPGLPHVANLVTYAAPHEGAPLAGMARKLESDTVTGGWFVDRAADLSEAGLPIPDPHGGAVEQLAPGSALLGALAREDVTFGTRVLALVMPHDVIVPADKALYAGKDSRILAPDDINGHDGVVRSDAARGHVYAFLRGAPRACISDWQEPGQLIGKGIGLAASLPVAVLEEVESAVVRKAVAVARGVKFLGTRGARWLGGRAGDAAEMIASAWSSLW
jgi:hypothetical protein